MVGIILRHKAALAALRLANRGLSEALNSVLRVLFLMLRDHKANASNRWPSWLLSWTHLKSGAVGCVEGSWPAIGTKGFQLGNLQSLSALSIQALIIVVVAAYGLGLLDLQLQVTSLTYYGVLRVRRQLRCDLPTLDVVGEECFVGVRASKLEDGAADNLVQIARLVVVLHDDVEILEAMIKTVERFRFDLDWCLQVLSRAVVP